MNTWLVLKGNTYAVIQSDKRPTKQGKIICKTGDAITVYDRGYAHNDITYLAVVIKIGLLTSKDGSAQAIISYVASNGDMNLADAKDVSRIWFLNHVYSHFIKKSFNKNDQSKK